MRYLFSFGLLALSPFIAGAAAQSAVSGAGADGWIQLVTSVGFPGGALILVGAWLAKTVYPELRDIIKSGFEAIRKEQAETRGELQQGLAAIYTRLDNVCKHRCEDEHA